MERFLFTVYTLQKGDINNFVTKINSLSLYQHTWRVLTCAKYQQVHVQLIGISRAENHYIFIVLGQAAKFLV